MNVAFSPAEEQFRGELRDFLRDYRDLDGFFLQGHKWERVKRLFCAMGERGWLSLAWPADVGGLELGPAYEYILWDEVAYARGAQPTLGGHRCEDADPLRERSAEAALASAHPVG